MHRFENALILVWIGENQRLLKTVLKKASCTAMHFHQRFRARYVDDSRNKPENASVGENILLRLRLLEKTHLCGRGLSSTVNSFKKRFHYEY